MTPYYDEGGITIYHGDCLEILPTLRRESIDLVLTDPPFFMPAQHYATRKKWQRSWGDTSILATWWRQVVEATVPLLRPTGYFLSFCDDESYPVFYPDLYRRFDILAALVWDKGGIGMGATWRHSHEFIIAARWAESEWFGGAARSDVLRVRPVPSPNRNHPVDKPIGLLCQLIEPTTRSNGVILDPFIGGGSTLDAARQLGRRAIGIEVEESYCERVATRFAQGVLVL
jgi:DNA modification methylase